MSNTSVPPINDLEEIDNLDYDEADFGFIIDADGELKSVMFPEKLMDDPPLEVQMILKIFGILNIEDLENKTLH